MSTQITARTLKLDKCNHIENAARSIHRLVPGDGSAKRHVGCKLMIHNKIPPEPAKISFYQTEDGQTRLEVAFRWATCWLSFNQLTGLVQLDKSVISTHIRNRFNEGKLVGESVVAKFAKTIGSITSTPMSSFPSATR